MLKPAELRAAIETANPDLANDPDKLVIFLDAGQIACRGVAGLSYEYRYTLNVIVQDYPHHADRIILPILAYLRTQQPELFENPDLADALIRFEVEMLNQETLDLSLKVDLTERVIVTESGPGRFAAHHARAPTHPQFPASSVTIEVVDRTTGETSGTYEIPGWLPTDFRYDR